MAARITLPVRTVQPWHGLDLDDAIFRAERYGEPIPGAQEPGPEDEPGCKLCGGPLSDPVDGWVCPACYALGAQRILVTGGREQTTVRDTLTITSDEAQDGLVQAEASGMFPYVLTALEGICREAAGHGQVTITPESVGDDLFFLIGEVMDCIRDAD